MNNEKNLKIFVDKLSLSSAILHKENQLIQNFFTFKDKINNPAYSGYKFTEIPSFNNTLRVAAEIYLFFKYNLLPIFKTKKSKRIEQLTEIMNKYYEDKTIGMKELTTLVDIIVEIITYGGYHDVLINTKTEVALDQSITKWDDSVLEDEDNE